jgi:hypothetical protein
VTIGKKVPRIGSVGKDTLFYHWVFFHEEVSVESSSINPFGFAKLS